MSENNEEQDKYELEQIRMKKLRAIMEAQKEQKIAQEKTINLQEKINYILKAVLSP